MTTQPTGDNAADTENATDRARIILCDVEELDYDNRFQGDGPDGEEVLVIRHEGNLVAMGALCPHQYAPLIGGEIIDNVLECPLHGWRFALATGADPDNPYVCVPRYECGIEDGKVWVGKALPMPVPSAF